jgi:hypothetical protein
MAIDSRWQKLSDVESNSTDGDSGGGDLRGLALPFRDGRLRLDGGGYFHFVLFESGLVGLDDGEG